MAQTENESKDWALIVGGILLILCGICCVCHPGFTLIDIALLIGTGFGFAGIMGFVMYLMHLMHRKELGLPGWYFACAICDGIISLMFGHPLITAEVIPWVIAAFVVLFAIFEIVGSFVIRKVFSGLWGSVFVSGIIDLVLGICLFIWPLLVVYFIALFALLRGINLIVFGFNSRSFA